MSNRVSTTLDVTEFGALDRLAEAHGLTHSAALRLLVTRYAEAEREEVGGLAQLLVVHPTLAQP